MTTDDTRYFHNGQEGYPCRCGLVHMGEHGSCEYAMHECFHAGKLLLDADTGLARCVACGHTWETEGNR